MEEMNAHNTHYNDLQSQALRDPTFDRSILELPAPPPFPQDEDENRDANTDEEDEDAIHYCPPCNRYFSSGNELAQVSRFVIFLFIITPRLNVTGLY